MIAEQRKYPDLLIFRDLGHEDILVARDEFKGEPCVGITLTFQDIYLNEYQCRMLAKVLLKAADEMSAEEKKGENNE